MYMVGLARAALQRLGIYVESTRNSLGSHRVGVFQRCGIDLVLDVGANTGQYASAIRRDGYRGRILSFEPLAAAFSALQQNARTDSAWQCVQVALGSSDTSADINVSELSEASSLLRVGARSTAALPSTSVVRTETIKVRRLDAVLGELGIEGRRAHLKLDVQGFEKEVLAGAPQSLSQVHSIEIELSLVELYKDQPLIGEMLQVLAGLRFYPVWLARGFTDPVNRDLLQVDCLLVLPRRLDDGDASRLDDGHRSGDSRPRSVRNAHRRVGSPGFSSVMAI
jgi:FkbM family methyltransferase